MSTSGEGRIRKDVELLAGYLKVLCLHYPEGTEKTTRIFCCHGWPSERKSNAKHPDREPPARVVGLHRGQMNAECFWLLVYLREKQGFQKQTKVSRCKPTRSKSSSSLLPLPHFIAWSWEDPLPYFSFYDAYSKPRIIPIYRISKKKKSEMQFIVIVSRKW